MAHLSAACGIIARPAGGQAGDLTVNPGAWQGTLEEQALGVLSVSFAEVDPVSRLGVLHLLLLGRGMQLMACPRKWLLLVAQRCIYKIYIIISQH